MDFLPSALAVFLSKSCFFVFAILDCVYDAKNIGLDIMIKPDIIAVKLQKNFLQNIFDKTNSFMIIRMNKISYFFQQPYLILQYS
jgi:hypothetical protein